MAAVTNATRTTEMTETIDSEWIDRMVQRVAETPLVAMQVVRVINAMGATSSVWTIPLAANQVGDAATITETDQAATAVNEFDSEVSLTVANIGISSFVSDQVKQRSTWSAMALAIRNGVHSVQDKLDEDVLSNSTSITTSIGSNATTHDLDNWNTVLTTFETQNATPGLPLASVWHPDAFRDFHSSIITTSAALLGTAFGEDARAQMQGRQGFKGVLDGVSVFTSDNIPADDTTGWGNILVTTPSSMGGGDGGCLAAAFWKGVGAEAARGSDGARRSGDWLVTTSWYATGINKQSDGLNFITKT